MVTKTDQGIPIPTIEIEGYRLALLDNGDGTFTIKTSASGTVFSIGTFVQGVGTNAQVLLYLAMDRAATFAANAPNSLAVAKTAATGSTTFSIKKNGVQFATVVFSAGGTTGTFTQASTTTFAIGDILEIDGPATADATLANVGITLQATR